MSDRGGYGKRDEGERKRKLREEDSRFGGAVTRGARRADCGSGKDDRGVSDNLAPGICRGAEDGRAAGT